MIYVTIHIEKNTSILSIKIIIDKSKNCKDKVEPQNQVIQQISSNPPL
jgi:hypothetical protein